MEAFLALNRWLHITAGFMGLAAFWVPLFVQKGGRVHRGAGKVFRISAMVVISAAGMSVMLNTGRAMSGGTAVADDPEGWSFLVFLGYLALVTGGILSHGIAVLRHKRDPVALDTLYRRLIAASLIAASAFIVGWALYWQPGNAIVLFALSPLGVSNGIQMLRVMRGQRFDSGQWRTFQYWKIEHLSAMIGCGIAFHTAFAVFGMTQFTAFDLAGVWQVLPWIVPAAIGIPATLMLAQRYRHQASASP